MAGPDLLFVIDAPDNFSSSAHGGDNLAQGWDCQGRRFYLTRLYTSLTSSSLFLTRFFFASRIYYSILESEQAAFYTDSPRSGAFFILPG